MDKAADGGVACGRSLRAIAMWDFSWLERRWPGAGYEDWNRALDELVERGYDAVRIDPYPHLLAADPIGPWELVPVWDQLDWGSPDRIEVRIQPALTDFVSKCAERDVAVALSSWFREDRTDARLELSSPSRLVAAWTATLDTLAQAGLLESILYVDLCNEYPMPQWAPWLRRAIGTAQPSRTDPEVQRWMDQSIREMRASYPGLAYCFSFATELRDRKDQDVTEFDLLEPHIWMAHPETSDFHERVGYDLDSCSFDPLQWKAMVRSGESVYRQDPDHWEHRLRAAIADAAEWSSATGKPLVTTEAWAVINYKDWPRADWGWVKELCELGVNAALHTDRWTALCTSNFCGPQFRGMWADVDWHRRLTDRIRRHPSHVGRNAASYAE